MDVTTTDFWMTVLQLSAIVVGAYLLVLWIALVVWTWRDIRARTDDALIQFGSVAMVAVFFLPGLLLYVAVRPPEVLAEAYQRRLEAEAFLQELENKPACPTCQRAVDVDFVACPYCRTTLRVACASCERPTSPSWVVCAYCGAERVSAPAARVPVPTRVRGRDGQRAPVAQSAS